MLRVVLQIVEAFGAVDDLHQPHIAVGVGPAAVGGVGECPAGAAILAGVESGPTDFATTGEIPARLTRAGILDVALSGC
jgi:hypothetical protein